MTKLTAAVQKPLTLTPRFYDFSFYLKTFSDQILAKLINHGVAAALFSSRHLSNFGNERIFLHLKIAKIDMGVNFGSRRTILDIKTHLFIVKPFSGGKLLTEVFQNSRPVYISCKYFKFEKKFHIPSFLGVMFLRVLIDKLPPDRLFLIFTCKQVLIQAINLPNKKLRFVPTAL